MKVLPAIFLIFFVAAGYGQLNSNISVASGKDSMYSNLLGEKRELVIYLPGNYNVRAKYPIVYLLDGEDQFHFFTGIVDHLSRSYVIPEMIVVGIINTNRTRDFTPTYDSSNFDKTNGGGETFTAFLEKELIPYIESRYSVAPYRLVVGHSLGGLLVVNTLVKHTHLFNTYIALDPALWWDRMKLFNSSVRLTEKRYNNRSLFIAISNSMPAGMTDTIEARRDTTIATLGIRSIFLFEGRLKQTSSEDLRWRSRYYPDESHASVPLIGSYDALKFIFDFYKRPSFQKLTDSTATILQKHYTMVSKKMGYTILPLESDLAGLAWRSATLEKNFDRALTFLKLYLKNYPESPGAYDSMGQYYEAKGEPEKAKINFEKAKMLRKTRTKEMNK